MANELHTFTGNEVIATELPELLNQNFDYVRENSLKSVNGVEKDENNNVDVTFLTSQVIPTNSDLNNFRESGEYTRELDTTVVANSPTEKPFFLTVLASENLVKQVVTEIDRKDPMTFTRTLSGANWSPWVEGGVDIGIWKSEETVKVGDVRFLKGRENAGYVLECVKAGVTGESQPVLEGDIAEDEFNLNNFDGTLSIEKGGTGASTIEGAKHNLGIENVPIGTILPFGAWEIPAGYLNCDGTAVSRIVYADLFAVIGTTYGAGDGSTTFNLPNLNNNSFLEGSTVLGVQNEAGLPNITGAMEAGTSSLGVGVWNTVGAFYPAYGVTVGTVTASRTEAVSSFGFDAHRSNHIYGNSYTVQPKSVTVKFCIKAYGAITNTGSVELEEMAKDYERIASSYLPLSGGTITGNITAKGDAIPTIGRVENNKQVTLYGGSSYETGAVIGLKGIDNHDIAGEEGGFFISSTDGITKHWLTGLKNGELLWDGSRVINGVSIQAQQTDGTYPIYLPAGGTWVGIWVFRTASSDYANTGIVYAAGGSLITYPAESGVLSAIYFRVI